MSGYQGYIAPPLPKAEILGGIEGFLKQHDNLLSKKKVKTMGASAVGRDLAANGVARDRSRGGVEGVELADFDAAAAQQEFEVDLLHRGFLEKEKDRIGELLVAHMKSANAGPQLGSQGGKGTLAVNGSLNPRTDTNPYELPSESESESEYGAGIQGEEGKDLVQLTAEALGRRQWKEQMRAKKREEMAKRLALDLSESEGEESVFESADEGLHDDESRGMSNSTRDLPPPLPYPDQGTHIRVAAFDVKRLPLAYGPKTTESLIDALFNPGITTDKTDDDPFVMYISPTELQRQDEWRREQEVRMQQYQEQLSIARQQSQQQQRNHSQEHWYKSRLHRSATRDSGADSEGLMTKLKKGVKRAGTLDSTASASTASASGSGSAESTDPRLTTSMKSPGEDTIVGVRRSEEEDVTSPATITAWSPNRDGQQWTPLGLAVDREATIGKGTGGGNAGGVGNFLSNYYRTKKDKVKDKMVGSKSQPKTPDESNVLGGAFCDQEPQDMYGSMGQPGQGRPSNGTNGHSGHQRRATGGTMSSTASSSSLSSLGLDSHGHDSIATPPQPSPVTTAAVGANVRRSTSTRSNTSFSAPPGRMDKTGVVKGTGSHPAVGEQPVEDGGPGGGGLKGWWKGLQR